MKTLSVQDAQEYFSKLNPSYYLFTTENQGRSLYPNCISMASRYKEVVFSKFTNRVCFRNGDNILCISKVECIKVDENPSIGVPFYIVCDYEDKKGKKIVFAFIAD